MKGNYAVLVDWNNDGDFGDAGEDVTARTLFLSWERGRDFASQLTGKSRGGSCRVFLDNRSGDYSSFNAASPLAGNLLPGRKVRIQGDSGDFPYDFPITFTTTVWQGFLSRLVPSPALHGAHTATLEAVGPLTHVNQKQVNMPMATNVLTSDAIDDILDDAGWPAADRVIAAGNTTMARHWQDKVATLTALHNVEETESGFVREGKDGKVHFEDRHFRLSGDPLTSQATFSDAPGSALTYSHLEQIDPLPHIFNILEADVQLYTVGSLAILWTLAEAGASSPALEGGGGQKIFWASFPNADSAQQAWGVDAWTTPVATTDYLVNTQADGLGTDLTGSVTVAVSKLANSMKITLTNNHASSGFITFLQARGTPVNADDPIKVKAEDATSQTAYGERTYPNPARFIPGSGEAQDWADFNLSIYKDPLPILAMTCIANRDAAHFAQAMGRDIGDRVTVVSANLGLNEDFFIESERHQVDAHLNHVVTWELSNADAFSGFWVLDTSELGINTRLAY